MLIATVGAVFFVGICQAAAAAKLKKEPTMGSLKQGQRVLVDDGICCPKGQIKK